MLFRPRLRQLKRKLQYAVQTDAGKHRLLQHKFAIASRKRLATSAGILAFGVFTDDQFRLAGADCHDPESVTAKSRIQGKVVHRALAGRHHALRAIQRMGDAA